MVHQAGVRTVTLGGKPITGPMQAVGGTRGARSYDAYSLDLNMQFVNDTIKDDEAASRLPPRNSGIWFDYIGFNLRDQVRDGDSIPQQFKYESADCRLFYTLQNVYNMSQLWRDVAHAAWQDSSLCVTNSTGFPTGRNSTSSKEPPRVTAKTPLLDLSLHDYDATENFTNPILDIGADIRRAYNTFAACHPNCPGGCITANVTCNVNGVRNEISICPPGCNIDAHCPRMGGGTSTCLPHMQAFSYGEAVLDPRPGDEYRGVTPQGMYTGRCYPDGMFETDLGCPTTP